MRILSPSCGFSPDATGGGERYEYDLTAGLTKRYHEVETVKFPFRGAGRWPWACVTMAPMLRAKLGSYPPYDLIRCHSPLYLGPACLLATTRTGLPLVTHVHHWEPTWPALERLVLERSKLLVVDSEFVSRQLTDVFVRAGRRDKLPPVIVTGCGVPEPERFGGLHGGFRQVLTIGPVIARKRPLELVRLWAEVLKAEPEVHLVWVGDGPLRLAALALAADLGISRLVHFLGRQPESEKAFRLRASSLFVFMSTLEGCPLAVLEAMSCGLPIVSTDQGPLPDLLNSSQAVPEPLMPARIIELLKDPVSAYNLGRRNREVWQGQYTPAAWLKKVEAAYRSVI